MLRVIKSKKNNLQLIVTGSHLFKSYGMTINNIIQDGFKINKRIKLSSQTDKISIIENRKWR